MTHAELVAVAAGWLKRRGCHAVLTERGHRHGEIPDAIGWNDVAIVVEVKVSVADFRADLEKPHRVDPFGLGRKRWYLTPKGLLTKPPIDIPYPWGLLEWDGRCCRVVREPTALQSFVASLERERALLVGELRAYHAQGIEYRKGVDRWGPRR